MKYGMTLYSVILIGLVCLWLSPDARCDSFKMEPSQGFIGTEVHVSGHSDSVKLATVSIYWPSLIPAHSSAVIAGMFADASGDFSGSFNVPYGYENGSYTIELRSGTWTVGRAVFVIGSPLGEYPIPPAVTAPSQWESYQETSGGVRALQMLSSDLGFAVDWDGGVSRFNGFAWIHLAQLAEDNSLRCISMISATDGWVGGTGGRLWHFDGSQWTLAAQTMPDRIVGLSAVSATNVWGVCGPENGTTNYIIHYDGSTWSVAQTISDTWMDWEDIKMISATNGWAIGTGFTDMGFTYGTYFFRYNGSTWSQQSLKAARLTDMSVVSANSIWAVGMNANRNNRTFTYAKWNGTVWTVTNATPLVGFQTWEVACDFPDANHGYVSGGNNSFCARYENGSWYYDSFPRNWANDIDMISASDGWLGNGEGFFRYYGDQHLRLVPSVASPGQRLTARVSNLTPSTQFWITWETPPTQFNAQILEPVRTDLNGDFEADIYVPANASSGHHAVILSTLQQVPGQGIQYVEVTRGDVSVRDGLNYSISMPDTTYVRLGGWGGMATNDESVEIAARVSSLLPPQPATGLPMTCLVRSSPPSGCDLDPVASQTDGDGFYRVSVSPAEGINVVDLFPTSSPLDCMSIRVVGYMQPPPPDPMPAGFLAQAWTGHGALRDIELVPNWGPPGTRFTVKGSGFTATQFAYAYWDGTDLLGQTHTGNGRFSLEADVPTTTGEHTVIVVTHAGDYAYTSFFVQNESPDTTPPDVSISYPAEGAVVSGEVTITAAATDSRAVSSMSLFIDDMLIARGTSGTLSSVWDTLASTPGVHAIMASATDRQGNRGLAAIQVSVDNTGGDQLAPNVTIVHPSPGQSVSGTFTARITATDNIGVTNIGAFLDHNTLIGSSTGSPCTFAFDTGRFPSGSHTFTARAFDAAHNEREQTVSFTIASSSFDETLPVISVSNPSDWQHLSGTISVQATATDNSGTAPRLSVQLNSEPLTESSSGQINYSLNTALYPSALYSLTFYAEDAEGNTQTKCIPVSICNLSRDEYTAQCFPPSASVAVSILTPQSGTELTRGCPYWMMVSMVASDLPVDRVDYKIVNQTTGEAQVDTWDIVDPPESAYIKQIEFVPVTSGEFRCELTARDIARNEATHSVVFNVIEPTQDVNCSQSALVMRVYEQYLGGPDIRIVVDPYDVPPGDLTSMTLNVVSVATGEQRTLTQSSGGLIDYTWATGPEADGEYRLIASAQSQGASVRGANRRVFIAAASNQPLAEVRLFAEDDALETERGFATFTMTACTYNDRGEIMPYIGDLTISSSGTGGILDFGDGEGHSMPFTYAMHANDEGVLPFMLTIGALGTRTISIEAETFSDSVPITLLASETHYESPRHDIYFDFSPGSNYFRISSRTFDSRGNIVAVDVRYTCVKPDGDTTEFAADGQFGWIEYQWFFGESQTGQYHITGEIREHFTGEVLLRETRAFTVIYSRPRLEFTNLHLFDPWNVFPLTGKTSSYDENLDESWGTRHVPIEWSITYPDGLEHSGVTSSDGNCGFMIEQDGPPYGQPRGIVHVVLRASKDGYIPVIEEHDYPFLGETREKNREAILLYQSTSPLALCNTDGQLIGNLDGTMFFNYPEAEYSNLQPYGGDVEFSTGDILSFITDPFRLAGSTDTSIRFVSATEINTVGLSNSRPIPSRITMTMSESASGARMLLPLPVSSFYLTAAYPIENGWDTALSAPIVLYFSTAVNPSSLQYEISADPGSWSVAWSAGNTIATLSHAPFTANNYYSFDITAASDSAGNPLLPGPVPLHWSFSTVPKCNGEDQDEDGYVSAQCGGTDCDDMVDSVHPGAAELLNGRDDDCDGVIDEALDGISPAAIHDLSAEYSESAQTVTFMWTATGDDGMSSTAASYDFRYADHPLGEMSWQFAVALSSEPAPATQGTVQNWTMPVTLDQENYRFAVKVRDESGNESGISNVAEIRREPQNTPVPTPTSSQSTHTPTPSPSPTHSAGTPTSTPTPPRTATPTSHGPTATPAGCGETGVTIEMSDTALIPGDLCSVDAVICNADGSPLSGYPIFVILEVVGLYYFAPTFSEYDNYLAMYPSVPTGQLTIEVLPEFEWPSGVGEFSGAKWYGAMTNPGISDLYGTLSVVEFGWSE